MNDRFFLRVKHINLSIFMWKVHCLSQRIAMIIKCDAWMRVHKNKEFKDTSYVDFFCNSFMQSIYAYSTYTALSVYNGYRAAVGATMAD